MFNVLPYLHANIISIKTRIQTLIQLNIWFWFFLILSSHVLSRKVVMVPDPRLDSCFYDIADQVLKSLLDLNPSDWGLPPFDNPAS